MKSLLLVSLIVFVMILVGCGNKYSDETVLIGYATFVEEKENINDYLDAEENFDEDFLEQQILDGKIKYIDKETNISVVDEMNSGKIVEVKFLQGRYKNKIGYVRSEFVRDLKKEKELAEKNEHEQREKEKAKLAAEEKEKQMRLEEEQGRLNKLVEEGEGIFGTHGLQIICTMGNSTKAYWKLIGATNLPEGMSLTIELAGIKKGSIVQKGGQFSALFERAIIAAGEQNLSIQVADRNLQSENIQFFDDTVMEEKGVGILGREIYAGKINVQ